MKSHNGMRPQDIVVLLSIINLNNSNWNYRDLAKLLDLSISEISESLNRSLIAGLINESKKNVYQKSLMEFIEFGLKYVFPQQPGTMVTGIPTAHSHAEFNKKFKSDMNYVWPSEEGLIRGLSIIPLYKGVQKAIKNNKDLYLQLAALDVLRVGKTRERQFALGILKSSIL